MITPVAPVFLHSPHYYWLDFITSIPATQWVSLRVSGRPYDCVGYDSNFVLWAVRFHATEELPSWWMRFIPSAMNRRFVERAVQWTQSGTYKIDELRGAFLDAIAHDHDNLTQFIEAEKLKERLQVIGTFGQFVEVWKWLSAEPDPQQDLS